MIEKIESDLHKDAVIDKSETHAVDLEISCSCTLQEFYYGSSKTLCFERTITQGDGKTSETEEISKEIEIKPGMKPGTVLRFNGEGNRPSDRLTGDLIVTVD